MYWSKFLERKRKERNAQNVQQTNSLNSEEQLTAWNSAAWNSVAADSNTFPCRIQDEKKLSKA